MYMCIQAPWDANIYGKDIACADIEDWFENKANGVNQWSLTWEEKEIDLSVTLGSLIFQDCDGTDFNCDPTKLRLSHKNVQFNCVYNNIIII